MQFHRAILDHLNEGVLATDAAGLVQYMNPVAERMTGWPLWEAVNRPLADILDQQGGWQGPPLPELLDSGDCILQHPCRYQARWGEILERRVSASPLYQGSFRCGTVLVFHEASPSA
jgi:PAS domain S-box-containing protein